MQEVLSQGVILRWLDNFWVNGHQKVLVEHLLPVGLVAANEYIAELGKAGHIIHVQLYDAQMNSRIVLLRVNLIPS